MAVAGIAGRAPIRHPGWIAAPSAVTTTPVDATIERASDPETWRDKTVGAESDHFDLVVIGAGSGGLAAAKRAASHGARVAVVEGDRVGGTCVIRGCVPKKLLVYGSAYRHLLADAASYGWSVGESRCDPGRLLAAVRAEVDRLNGLHIGFLERAGVELVTGWGRFLDAHHVEVSRRDGSRRVLHGARVLIAAGGRPHRPAIPGAELGWVSDDMFLLEDLPQRVLIVGGGFIACEFACILHGLGVVVDQFVRGDHLLRGFDMELSDVVREGMEAAGINLHFAQTLTAISGQPGDLIATTSDGLQEPCGGVLLATGRKPFLAGLELAAAGVHIAAERIPVDGDQRTNVPHIFAVGDITDRINLTPVAVDEGRAFADSLYGGRPRQVDHDLVASAVFSQPELATVGLSEEQALARYGPDGVRLYRARFRSMAQALPQSGPRCLLKLVVEVASGRVLGCHMVGEHAAEIIQMAAIAIGMGATKADFDRTMALHPTVSEEFVTMPE
ncbi:glutathione-disulfide reductase [Synechococcus sp. CS-205]|nr:glutathione-disulfide reductase [Synechococcus sp. CS-205]